MTRYLSGLCVAGVGLCGGAWLVMAAVVFGRQGGEAARVNLATGAGLMLAACVTGVAWAVAWRRRMRVDGVLGDRFLLVSRRQARRNRRELARDIRSTARQSKRAARRARRGADGPGRPSVDGFVDETRYLGIVVHEQGPNGHALHGRAPGTADSSTELASTELTSTGLNGLGHGGHDGASAEDLLGELRSLLGPLIAAAGPAPAPLSPPQRVPAAQARPELPHPPAMPPAADEELGRLADSEEAWW